LKTVFNLLILIVQMVSTFLVTSEVVGRVQLLTATRKMKQIFLCFILIHLALGCVQAQSAHYAAAYQNTTVEENTQWLQKRLSFTSSHSAKKKKTRTTVKYDPSAQTLIFSFTNLSGTSTIKRVRLHLAKLDPGNISISQIGRPSPSRTTPMVYEYVIFVQAPQDVNAVQIVTDAGGQEEGEFYTDPYGIGLPEPLNQDKEALEEIVGRLQQTILLINRK
jgi:hypothetical protein